MGRRATQVAWGANAKRGGGRYKWRGQRTRNGKPCACARIQRLPPSCPASVGSAVACRFAFTPPSVRFPFYRSHPHSHYHEGVSLLRITHGAITGDAQLPPSWNDFLLSAARIEHRDPAARRM